MPLETVKQKCGAAELKVRESPSDPRFPEFLELREEKVHKTEQTKLKQRKLDAKSTWDDFKQLAEMEATGQIEGDSDSEAEGAPEPWH